jgi:hypothetical protein
VATQVACGGPSVFCPPGMLHPLPVSDGYYTGIHCEFFTFPCCNSVILVLVGLHGNTTQSQQKKCEPGYYCTGGVKSLCDRGYFGAEFGMVRVPSFGLPLVNTGYRFRQLAPVSARLVTTAPLEAVPAPKLCVAIRTCTVPRGPTLLQW